MRIIAYLLSVFLALPCVVFAIGLLALNHVIETRNPFKIFYHFLLAFGWGVPAVALALVSILVAGFFPTSRIVGATFIVFLNLAALAITLINVGWPRDASEAVFLIPSFVSMLIVVWVASAKSAPSR